jgi:hypothetical protein
MNASGTQLNEINPADLAQYGKAIVFDPQDLRTLYQDAAGTIPVTGVEQPVGLMLDKGQGLELGPELIVGDSSTFDSGIGNWVVGQNCTISTNDGCLRITQTAINGRAVCAFAANIGSYYIVSALVRCNPGSIVNIGISVSSDGAGPATFSSSYTGQSFVSRQAVRLATAATMYAVAGRNGGGADVIEFDNISVRELKGYPATQPTADSRPTLSGSPSFLTFDGSANFAVTALGGKSTTAFYLCASVKIGKVNSAQTIISDTGTNTGYRVRINASNQLEFSAGNGSAYTTVATAGTPLALNDVVVLSAWHDGTNINAQINNGTIYQTAFATATAGTDALTIGKDNGAASSYFGGNIYATFNSGPVPNINLRDALKRHYAAKAGIRI